MKKILTTLLLTMAVISSFAASKMIPQQSSKCVNSVMSATIVSFAVDGKYNNPNAYAKDPNYNIHPLTNTLTYELFKYLNVTEANFSQAAALASAIEMKFNSNLAEMVNSSSKICGKSVPEIYNVIRASSNRNDPSISEAAYKLIKMYVPHYLRTYGYIQ